MQRVTVYSCAFEHILYDFCEPKPCSLWGLLFLLFLLFCYFELWFVPLGVVLLLYFLFIVKFRAKFIVIFLLLIFYFYDLIFIWFTVLWLLISCLLCLLFRWLSIFYLFWLKWFFNMRRLIISTIVITSLMPFFLVVFEILYIKQKYFVRLRIINLY